LDEREIHPKPDDPKVTRIVRYESGTGEVIEIIEVPDPHKAAEYKVRTNDELRPKPGCRFKGKTAIRASGRRNAFIHPSAWKVNSPLFAAGVAPRLGAWHHSHKRLHTSEVEGDGDVRSTTG
jgi:hypothetical protein